MHNKISKFYRYLLYLSLLINTSFIFSVLFCIINIKFVIFETFFENFYEFVYITGTRYFNFDILYHKNRDVYNYFVASLNYVDVFCYYIVFIIITGLIINLLFKKNIYKYIFSIIFFSITTYFLYLYFLPLYSYNIITVFTIFIFFVLFNYNIKFVRILKIFLLIPILNFILFPSHIFNILFKHKNNTIKFLIFVLPLITSFIFLNLIPHTTGRDNIYRLIAYISEKSNKIIKQGNFYTLYIHNDNILITNLHKLILFKQKQYKTIYESKKKVFSLQSILFNPAKNEYYFYDCATYTLYVYDNDLKMKNKTTFTTYSKEGCERMAIDDLGQNIVIVTEFGGFYLVNTEDLKLKVHKTIINYNDSVVYNPYRQEFLMSFYANSRNLISFSLKDYKFHYYKSHIFQGNLALSKQNKELYLSFPQKGKIYVYDAETYKFKYKLKTLHMAKSLYYSEEKNILIVLSYNTGYIDIFLMDKNNPKLLERQFIGGYRLEDTRLAQDNKTIYISSIFGLYKTSLEI